MKIFSYDGILAQIVRYIWNLFVLNMCFVICCLPVVTAGAAITALYSVYLNESMESSQVVQFFHAFKSNFRKATLIWLVFLGLAAVLGVNIYLLLTYNLAGDALLKVLTVLVVAVCFCIGAFIFPLQAHYENTLKQTWRNALVLGIALFPYSVFMTAVSFLPILLFFINLDILVILLTIWLPLGGALSARINSWVLKRVFERLNGKEPQEGTSEEKGE